MTEYVGTLTESGVTEWRNRNVIPALVSVTKTTQMHIRDCGDGRYQVRPIDNIYGLQMTASDVSPKSVIPAR